MGTIQTPPYITKDHALKKSSFLLLTALLCGAPIYAQQQETYDYARCERDMIRNGVQAVLMCNGLFTSNRSLDQVFTQELAYLPQPVGTARGGDYEVDWERRAVAVGVPGGTPVMRAAFRDGIGCVVLAPDQTFEDIDKLPQLDMPPLPGDPARIPWPEGDLVEDAPLPDEVGREALAAAKALGNKQTYLEFPRKALLDRIGMRNTLLSTDRFGDFILSSQVYTNARDLARFGLLYLNGGVWEGERLLSEDWIGFVRTPAPSTAERGSFYGGQWWLAPDDRKDVPKGAYSTAGNRGQYVIVVPSHGLVIVRRGLDYGQQGFDRWDLLREVLKAFPE